MSCRSERESRSGPACGTSGRVSGGRGGAAPGPAEVDVAGKWGGVSVRSVEPEVSLGLSLGDVLLGLRETGDGQPDDTSVDSAGAGQGPVPRLRMPDGRVEREPLLGGFCRSDRTGRLTSPRVVTRREGEVLACKLYRVGEGRALYAGVLKAAGPRASVEAAPGAGFRCRNSPRLWPFFEFPSRFNGL